MRREQSAHALFGRGERKITYIKFGHSRLLTHSIGRFGSAQHEAHSFLEEPIPSADGQRGRPLWRRTDSP
jgi:hypothetical protein